MARKLTKAQKNDLRSHKYHVFERSYDQCLKKLNLLKVIGRSNSELHQYSLARIMRMFEFVEEAYPNEMLNLGITDKKVHYINLATDRKLRNVKLSIMRE